MSSMLASNSENGRLSIPLSARSYFTCGRFLAHCMYLDSVFIVICVSEPQAVATGSPMTFDWATMRLVLFQATHMIRSLPLAVLTRRHLTAPSRPDKICGQASEHTTETDCAIQRILVHETESYHAT